MSDKHSRREFIKSGAALATTAVLYAGTPQSAAARSLGTRFDLVAVKGEHRFDNTVKAIKMLGDLKTLLPARAKVGLLVNSPAWWKNPGSFTHPDVVLATILACLEADARQLCYLIDPAANFWQRTPLATKYKKEIGLVEKCSRNYIEKKVPKGKALKTVKIIRELFDCDAYINLPIIKHHNGTHVSCSLKNLMGANTNDTNQFFHHGSGAKESYGDVQFLSQCIADLNTLRRPALCIVDASQVLSTNGPAGPGELVKLNTVVAGRDPVAVDAYCATLLGRDPKDILMIQKSAQHQLGNSELKQLNIGEVAI